MQRKKRIGDDDACAALATFRVRLSCRSDALAGPRRLFALEKSFAVAPLRVSRIVGP